MIKKITSLFMLLIAALMAFHLSFAIHYCSGHVASVDVFGSASGRCCCGGAGGEEAGCSGWGQDASAFPLGGSLTDAGNACCSDSFVTMETDEYQMPSAITLSGPDGGMALFVFLPVQALPLSETAVRRVIRPPGCFRHGPDLLAQICILRI
ncbi:MAG: hypothetical protein LBL42_05575 [Tannerella sp.]|jgi:hypothetical protein|nr:hypothetical protein [Tannerella sp.]